MPFIKSAVNPHKGVAQAYYFCFFNDDILVNKSHEGDMFPLLTAEKAKELRLQDERFIGLFNNRPCYSVAASAKDVSDKYQWISLRGLYLEYERELADIAGYAKQIVNWNRNFRFCGRCASETVVLEKEHARVCEQCKLINYPRISPAVIVAVIKDDQILLARGVDFPDKQMFSVLAGFLEPGEALEVCLKREVFEEVGIELTNVRYFKSQFWPFPDSLMIGFTADYQSGDIKIDESEIAEAGWFKAGALPKVPLSRSLSSELIQWFVDRF